MTVTKSLASVLCVPEGAQLGVQRYKDGVLLLHTTHQSGRELYRIRHVISDGTFEACGMKIPRILLRWRNW